MRSNKVDHVEHTHAHQRKSIDINLLLEKHINMMG